MKVRLIDVPYDSGALDVRMGTGPSFLLHRGIARSLAGAGHEVQTSSVRLPAGFHTEWDALVHLQRQVAALVRSALASAERPIVLSGNCGPAALGVLAALQHERPAVGWFDAHADFNTPETSPSGFLDGTSLAIATGGCWREASRRLEPCGVREDHVALVGVRSTDPHEEVRLQQSAIARICDDRGGFAAFLRRSAGATLYLHIDLDVIDPAELRASVYATPHGISCDDLIGFIKIARSELEVTAASVTSLDASADPEHAWPVAERIIHALADVSRGPSTRRAAQQSA